MLTILRLFVLVAIVFLSASPVLPATWDGGGPDKFASTPANWAGNALPVYGDSIIFNATSKDCTWDLDIAYSSLAIDGGYAGVVTPSSALILSSNFVPPDAPSGLIAATSSANQIDLSWADNSATEAGYKIESKIGADGTFAEIAIVGPGVTAYNDTFLSPATTYYYRILAYNIGGNSAYSDSANATTSAAAPIAATNPASNKNGSSATLNGTVNPNGLDTTVYFEWGSSDSYGNTTPSQGLSSGSGAMALAANITELSITTPYHYRVVAVNSIGTTYGADVVFTTPPITLTITSPTNGTTIYRPDIMVTGTLATPGNETGVTVNAKVAMVHNNTFVVNHVPLEDGVKRDISDGHGHRGQYGDYRDNGNG